jgi:iron transport multicopper oxidase
MSGASSNSSFADYEHTVVLPPNKTIELHLSGEIFQHPFHLHGHTFDVLQSYSGGPYNCNNPPRRDVAVSTPGRTTILRFKTDNSGPWIFHCHIDWHLKMGLVVVFAEDPATQRNTIKPPQDWLNLCPAYEALGPDFV